MVSKAPSMRLELRAVFYKESGAWFCHCLEMDVMGHGSTKKAAVAMMAEAVRLQIMASMKANNPSNIFMPADAKFFKMFASGKDVAVGVCEIMAKPEHFDGVEIDGVKAREYSGDFAMA